MRCSRNVSDIRHNSFRSSSRSLLFCLASPFVWPYYSLFSRCASVLVGAGAGRRPALQWKGVVCCRVVSALGIAWMYFISGLAPRQTWRWPFSSCSQARWMRIGSSCVFGGTLSAETCLVHPVLEGFLTGWQLDWFPCHDRHWIYRLASPPVFLAIPRIGDHLVCRGVRGPALLPPVLLPCTAGHPAHGCSRLMLLTPKCRLLLLCFTIIPILRFGPRYVQLASGDRSWSDLALRMTAGLPHPSFEKSHNAAIGCSSGDTGRISLSGRRCRGNALSRFTTFERRLCGQAPYGIAAVRNRCRARELP